MTPRTLLALALVALAGGAAGWFAARRSAPATGETPSAAGLASRPAGTRKILYYQSAMHPWIRSDRPGKCTICGMDLTPVFEGDAGFALDPGRVTLSSNALTVLGVATTEIRRAPLIRTLRVAGTLEDDDSRHRIISAWVAGRIEDLFVNYVGAEVSAGQRLARFFSPMLLEAERQYVALVNAPASPDVETSREHLLLHQSAAERLRQLGLTRTQIDALPGKPVTNHFTEILAPVSGTVVSRFVYAGQSVMEGEKLFEIADLSTLWFRFDAYEQDLPWLSVGQTVEVTTPAAPGRTFPAPIRFIDPSLTDMTRSAKVRVEITNPPVKPDPGTTSGAGRLLRHRLYAEGRVKVSTTEVPLVPRSAVLSPDGGAVVYVDHSGGAYERRLVKLGRMGDTDYEVLDGLAPGEKVVTSGNLLIDAQAQLNQTLHAADHHDDATNAAPAKAPSYPRLEPVLAEAAAKFLAQADNLRTQLAEDSLAGFNDGASRLHAEAETLVQTFASATNAVWKTAAETLAAKAHLTPATDLRAARKAWHPLSAALVDFARHLRTEGDPGRFGGLKIYQCPMTAEAFDGAPPRAQWLQLTAPLRNPWFGREMLECGVEVNP